MNIKLILAGAIAAAALTAGCTVVTDPEPAAYAEVEVAPVNVETYPSTVYEGHTVYYVGDRWVYRHGPRWVYYRQEPRELERHRRRYVQQAPAAPRREAPPAERR